MQARAVPAALVTKTWPLIKQWVAEGLLEGKADIAPEEVLRRLQNRTMQLWLAWDEEANVARGCCITELVDSVRGSACNLVIVAGHDFKTWRKLTRVIKLWAKEHGCVRLEAGGREGWQRYVRSDGWKRIRTIIEMRLDDG